MSPANHRPSVTQPPTRRPLDDTVSETIMSTNKRCLLLVVVVVVVLVSAPSSWPANITLVVMNSSCVRRSRQQPRRPLIGLSGVSADTRARPAHQLIIATVDTYTSLGPSGATYRLSQNRCTNNNPLPSSLKFKSTATTKMDQTASSSRRPAPGRNGHHNHSGKQVIEAKVIQVPRSGSNSLFNGHHLVAVLLLIQLVGSLCWAAELQASHRAPETGLIEHSSEAQTRRQVVGGVDEASDGTEAGGGLAAGDDEAEGEADGQWLPLNESLQLLLDDRIINDNDLVLKRPPAPAADQPVKTTLTTATATAAAATTTTTISIGKGDQNQKQQSTAGRVGSAGGGSTSSGQARRVQRLLVRQLTSLIMNNEPEQIAENIGDSTRLSGQIMSETSLASGNNRQVVDDDDDDDDDNINKQTTMSLGPSPPSDGDSGIHRRESLSSLPSSTINNNNNEMDDSSASNNSTNLDQYNSLASELEESTNQMAMSGFQEDAAITCPPDYEDLEASAGATGNLTLEQQQQLLSDSSALLINSTSANSTSQLLSSSDLQHTHTPNNNNNNNNQQLRHQLMAQCYHQGLQRIEFIVKVITPILFGVIIVVGLLGNIIVMLVILEDRKTERELTPTNLLILDLSLADLSFIIFCIPFTAWDYAVSHWVFGPLWCKFNQYLIVVCALSSIYTLVLMSIDRFMAIVYPIECISYRTSKNMLHAIYIKWIIILLIALPTWKMHGLIDSSFGPDHYDCRLLADQYNPLHFQIIFFITSYLFPLILIFCLYFGLLNKLWFGSKPHGHKESLKMLESKKKVTWLVAGIVIVFAACWCPIQVMLILMRLKVYKITPTYVALQVFSHTLGYMNSCVNPIVYAFASETFHQSFKRSWLGRAFNWMFCTDCCSVSNTGGTTSNNNNNNNTITNLNNYLTTTNHNNGHSAIVGMNSNSEGHHHQTVHNLASTGSTRSANHHHHLSTRFMSTRLSEQHQTMSSLTGKHNVANNNNSSSNNNNNNNNNKLRNQSLNHIFTSPSGNQQPGSGELNSSGRSSNNHNNNQDRGSLDNDVSCCTSTLMMTNTTPQHDSLQSDSNHNDIGQGNGNARMATITTSSRQPLPLEPRDRPTVLVGRCPSSNQLSCKPPQPLGSPTSLGHTSMEPTCELRLIPRQPTASGSFLLAASSPRLPATTTTTTAAAAATAGPPKQQLVAQMVSQTSASGNQQVAHRCEPMDQQEP